MCGTIASATQTLSKPEIILEEKNKMEIDIEEESEISNDVPILGRS